MSFAMVAEQRFTHKNNAEAFANSSQGFQPWGKT